MKLTIHRGAREIGGSCIQLQSGGTSILLDMGLPLVDENRLPFDKKSLKDRSFEDLIAAGVLPDIPGLYADNGESQDAVLISHPHQDHYGLLGYKKDGIPVYMSRGCEALVKASGFFGQIEINCVDIRIVESWQSFSIGCFNITPYLVDHSGFDSFAYLIKAEGRRIFYSGDFRGHGRKRVLFDNIIKDPPQEIDYLILEGTMIDRNGDDIHKTEEDVEHDMVKRFKECNELFFVACSSQNIDRIVSVYRACLQSGRTFVIDPYTAKILDSLKVISDRIPQADWGKSMRVFFIPNSYTDKMAEDKSLFKFKSAKITWEEIAANRGKMVIKDSYTMRSIFQSKKCLDNTRLIYSMWEGYLPDVKPFWDKHKVPIELIHCSGHAYVEDLKRFVDAVKPGVIIPNHTFAPDEFGKIFKGHKVKNIEDRQPVHL